MVAIFMVVSIMVMVVSVLVIVIMVVVMYFPDGGNGCINKKIFRTLNRVHDCDYSICELIMNMRSRITYRTVTTDKAASKFQSVFLTDLITYNSSEHILFIKNMIRIQSFFKLKESLVHITDKLIVHTDYRDTFYAVSTGHGISFNNSGILFKLFENLVRNFGSGFINAEYG